MIFIDILCVIALIIWLIRDEYVYKGKEAGNGCLLMLLVPVVISIGFLLYGKLIGTIPFLQKEASSDALEVLRRFLVGLIIPLGLFFGMCIVICHIRNRRRKK